MLQVAVPAAAPSSPVSALLLPSVALPVLPKVKPVPLPVVPPIPVYKFALPDVKAELAKAFVGVGIAQHMAPSQEAAATPVSAAEPSPVCMLL